MNSFAEAIDEVEETLALLQNFSISDRKPRQNVMDEATLSSIINAAVKQATEQTREEFQGIVDQLSKKIDELQPPSAVQEYRNIAIVEGVDCDESLDIVKSVPEFKGEAFKYVSWRQAAVTAHKQFERYQGSSKYYQAVAILRNKIVGRADSVLSSYNTVLNFYAILDRLDFAYSDKTSIYTLEQELSTLRQRQRPIINFYSEIEIKLTSIINKVIMSYDGNSSLIQSLNQKYRMDALRVFISGLNEPLCDTLFACKPADLPTALAMAQELGTNQNRYRFATVYNNGLGNVQQVYFPHTNPKLNNFKAPFYNNRSSSNFSRQPTKNLPFNTQAQQPQQYYVQPQQFYPPSSHFYSQAPVGHLPFNNQMRQSLKPFYSQSPQNPQAGIQPSNTQGLNLQPRSQAIDTDASMRTVRSTTRPNFHVKQSVNHLGHETQQQNPWENESAPANQENVSFEDEINFLGENQFSPTLREE